jgi:acetoin utilization deacetylase AcuC-like enzyme
VLRSGICKSASSLSQSQSQTSATEEEGIVTVTLNNDTNTATTTTTTTTTDYDDDTAAAAAAAAAISEDVDVDVANESLLKLIIKSISQYDGTEPLQNKVHCPFVYHNGYSNVKDWPLKHTFPMMKFEKIANALLTTSTSTSSATTTTTCSSSPTSPTSATATITTASPSTSSTTQPPLVRSRNDFFSPPDFPDLPIDDWLDILYSNNNNNNNNNSNSNSNKNNLFGYRFLNGQLTKDEERQIGFREQTSKKGLIERTFLEIGGTILTTQLALKYGIAANLAGGTHHAHPNGGAGYTILNDLAITSKLISLATTSSSTKTNSTTNTTKVKTKTSTTDHHDYNIDYTNIKRILVIDCDVHQGDGTAQYSTLWKKDNDNDEKQKQFLFTLSIHCESNYPFIKYNSTYDVGLQDHCTDEEYMTELKYIVNHAINEIQPDIILYDAGVDVYKYDTLGRIDLSEEYGIRLRDRYVIEKCVSMNIPIACVVGGGYDKDIDALGRRHAILHEECAYVWQKYRLWERRQ